MTTKAERLVFALMLKLWRKGVLDLEDNNEILLSVYKKKEKKENN
jgi:hypothetical protein